MNTFTMCYPVNLPCFISQKWGEDPEYYNKIKDTNGLPMKGHNGYDFGVIMNTPVYACHDGIVMFTGTDISEAKTIQIDTVKQYVYKGQKVVYRTFYGHLSEFKCIPGQLVKKGELIGLSGNSGKYTSGPHLHFGIHPMVNYKDIEAKNGYNGAIDPTELFDGSFPKKPLEESFINDINKKNMIKFLTAVQKYQIENNILDFKNSKPEDVTIGKKTLMQYCKDKGINYKDFLNKIK